MRAAGSRFAAVNMEVISRTKDGVLQGGVIYENYTGEGGSCLVHMAGFNKHWIDRDMLWVMFDYPFRQLDCTQAFCQVKGSDAAIRKLNKSFGWKEVIILEAVFPDDDMVIMNIQREGCRFLNLKPRGLKSNKEAKNGQAKSAATP